MMFFLLRCVLWLSIVYAAILLPQLQWRQMPAETIRAGTQAVGHAKQRAVELAVDHCVGRVSGCVDEATRLTALIAAATDPVVSTSAVHRGAAASAPSRRSRDLIGAMLTQRP